MIADPCIPADLEPRRDDGSLISAGRFLLGFPTCLLPHNRRIPHLRLPASNPANTLHCDQLGIPFADLPFCQ